MVLKRSWLVGCVASGSAGISQWFWIFLLAFGVAGAEPAKLPAWEVRKGNSAVYLIGSIHALRQSDYPLPSLFDRLASRSKQIVFELLQEDLDSLATIQLIQELGLYPPGTGIYDEVSADTYALLQAYAAENKLPRDVFDQSRPWLVSGDIDNREAAKAGFKSQLGVEQYFYKLARDQQKAIRALETADFQIRLFAGTTLADQEAQLRASLTKSKENIQSLVDLIGYWKNGDIEAMRQTINAAEDPAAYARFFTDRNRNWTSQIGELLEQGTVSLVIGGAGHFVGPDSVIELLKQQGHRIEQLPIASPTILEAIVSGQKLRLRIQGSITRTLTVYSSPDLAAWTPEANIDNPNGIAEFTVSTSAAVRFYRVASGED